MNADLESLWKIYETTSEWVRFSDTKASAILATEAVIASVLLPQVPTVSLILQQNILLLLLFLATISMSIFSFYYAVRALVPRIGIKDTVSVIFFAQIARRYRQPSDYEDAVRQLFVDDAQIRAQVSQEVWAVSNIAAKKYQLVNHSIVLFIISVFLGLVTLTGTFLL